MNDLINLEEELKRYFNYETFRVGQKEIITSVLDGSHTLATLPTGSGKSITYQLPALISSGITVVVSPLISLMFDQVKILKAKGIKRVAALNSLMSYEQKQQILNHLKHFKLLYCSPEMLQQEWLINRLKSINVSYLVIDEAHCISQWGHEFRTDYLKLHSIYKQLDEPTVLALSATATPEVQVDIVGHLQINMNKIIYPVDRPNITLATKKVEHQNEKEEYLIHLVENNRVPTMVYFSSRQVSEEVYQKLQAYFPDRRVACYHGGMEQDERLLIQQQFMYDQLDVICCTSAFGMGVDKSNIRLVVHYHMPSTLESYIQEMGRAGRDGKHSLAVLIYQLGDETIPFQLINSELPNDLEIETFLQSNRNEELIDPLTETKTKFLNFQLERNKTTETSEIASSIKNVRDHRLEVKKQNIFKMLHWIHTKGCRRESLYQSFQDGVENPINFCCDYCDFNLNQWSFLTSEEQKLNVLYDWEKRLNAIFNRR
ncbi:RecQ family ATP-dependent DNA helicase [Alkalibacillus silvisoli]|uniref:ATP-dependent DNA helicase RecQ n=1 Tax=Alkalibacillus silvisoli TaxID=392823 RepID=A0ABN0ZTR1_9BACI